MLNLARDTPMAYLKNNYSAQLAQLHPRLAEGCDVTEDVLK